MCRKVLTSQLQAISPDAKVIDARKLVSPILQFALSIFLAGSSNRGYCDEDEDYSDRISVKYFSFFMDLWSSDSSVDDYVLSVIDD